MGRLVRVALLAASALLACAQASSPVSVQTGAGTVATTVHELAGATAPAAMGGTVNSEPMLMSPVDAAVPVVTSDAAAPSVSGSLLAPDHWLPTAVADDPFADRPALVECSAAAVLAEELGGERALGIDTGQCNYAAVTQLTQRAVSSNELIVVRVWHFELNAGEAAEAHVALVIDGLSIVDLRVPIPQPGGIIKVQVRAPRAIPAGAAAHFHLHNHGANTWALLDITVGP
ncbi:MAG: hypothetical protein RL701_1805 [Pseudomonadota bacterium]